MDLSKDMSHDVVSIILPVYNASMWLPDCLASIACQSCKGPLELSVYNDGSTDDSLEVIKKWRDVAMLERDIQVILSGHAGNPKGVGFAKNQAISQSTGEYLCFLDADDVMNEDRIVRQLEVCRSNPNAIIGCKFHREPTGSTQRYVDWANNLTNDQLYTQCYTSNGPTVIMPTWFCRRSVIKLSGHFDEGGKGSPEDLILFYKHLRNDGQILRVDEDLLMYRYHPNAETFSIKEETIWNYRVKFLEECVLCKWPKFSIWNAGKQGRKLFRSLSQENQKKVTMFCDIDEKKISKQFYIYEDSIERPKPQIPIVHFTNVQPPIIICVKLKLSGNFEDNLLSLNLKEGTDYFHFN